MVDIYLIVLAVVAPIMILTFSFYVLVYYQHPDDNWTNYLPKVVVVLGLSLALVSILMLPFDVANQSGGIGCTTWNSNSALCGGLDLVWMWQVLYLLLGFWFFLLIPFTIFYYESYEPGSTFCGQLRSASIFSIIIVVIWIVILVVAYVFLNPVALPVQSYEVEITNFRSCSQLSATDVLRESCVDGLFTAGNGSRHVFTANDWPVILGSSTTVNISSTFLIFLVSFLTFIGWFFFAVYAGIGLVSFPLDLLRAFWYRPRFMSRDLYAKTKLDISKRTAELLELGNQINSDLHGTKRRSWKEQREGKKLYRQFKQEVINLEDEYEGLKFCHENWKNYNPLIPYCKYLLGMISVVLSLVWVIHIVVFMLIRTPYPDGDPAAYFLNTFFNWASKESGFALLGTVFVGVFCVYLLFCTMSGTAKLGLRFLIVEIHPLKVGATYMSSMLFNLSLLLLCVPPLIQFCNAAFSEYMVLTNADTIFGQFVRFMLFFQIFFDNNVFVIAMLVVMLLSMILFYFCCRNQNMRNSVKLRERIKNFESNAKKNEKMERRRKPSETGIEMT